MHHIQRKILNLLMYAPSLAYAQMRPKGVESNHFAYHLEQLVKAGLIAKQGRSYALTIEGLVLADRVTHADMAVRKQPHIITASYITNQQGQALLFKHTYQPYMDLYGFVQGRLHFDETIEQAAQREVLEKTGLKGVPLTHRGIAYVTATKNGVTISRLLAHIFAGVVLGEPTLAAGTQKGVSSWQEISGLKDEQYMPGFKGIKRLIDESDTLFFAEIDDSIAA